MKFKLFGIIFHIRFWHWIFRTPNNTYSVECPMQFEKTKTILGESVRSWHYKDTIYEKE